MTRLHMKKALRTDRPSASPYKSCDVDKIPPRVPNSFFLFKKFGTIAYGPRTSKQWSEDWRGLTQTDREYWKRIHQEEKAKFMKAHPEYRYGDVKGRKKAAREARKAAQALQPTAELTEQEEEEREVEDIILLSQTLPPSSSGNSFGETSSAHLGPSLYRSGSDDIHPVGLQPRPRGFVYPTLGSGIPLSPMNSGTSLYEGSVLHKRPARPIQRTPTPIGDEMVANFDEMGEFFTPYKGPSSWYYFKGDDTD